MRCIAKSLNDHYGSDNREMKLNISFVFNIMGKFMLFIQHHSHSLAFFECKKGDIIPGAQAIMPNSEYIHGVQYI